MDGIRESFVCEGVGGCVWRGASVPTRSGRENAPEGRHWPIRKQRRLSRRGHPGAAVALWSRKGAGPDHWFGIHHFTPSFEELRERIGKSRLQRKGEKRK